MHVSIDGITMYRSGMKNWRPYNVTDEGRKEWHKEHYLCRYKIVCPVQEGGVCKEPIFGYGEEDESYVYCYTRGDFKTKFRHHKLGGVVIFPKEDYKLINLECPDMFINNPTENSILDSSGKFFNYPAKSFNDSLMTYAKFLKEYTLESDLAIDSDIDLRYKYVLFNKRYFEGKLPYNIKVMWDRKARERAGEHRYWYKDNKTYIYREELGISIKYLQKYPHSFSGTLLHEMIHVMLPFDHHNNNFKWYMYHLSQESGIEITQYTEGRVNPMVINWVYICKKCGHVYKNNRRTKDLNSVRCGERGCKGRLDEITYEYYQEMYE